MNFSARPFRQIASNLLWTPRGFVRDPLLTLGADGSILHRASCAAPDGLPCTEFYAGILVPDFPSDYRTAFARMLARTAVPLDDLLREAVPASPGVLVVLSGLDYPSMRLTEQSQILRIG